MHLLIFNPEWEQMAWDIAAQREALETPQTYSRAEEAQTTYFSWADKDFYFQGKMQACLEAFNRKC